MRRPPHPESALEYAASDLSPQAGRGNLDKLSSAHRNDDIRSLSQRVTGRHPSERGGANNHLPTLPTPLFWRPSYEPAGRHRKPLLKAKFSTFFKRREKFTGRLQPSSLNCRLHTVQQFRTVHGPLHPVDRTPSRVCSRASEH